MMGMAFIAVGKMSTFKEQRDKRQYSAAFSLSPSLGTQPIAGIIHSHSKSSHQKSSHQETLSQTYLEHAGFLVDSRPFDADSISPAQCPAQGCWTVATVSSSSPYSCHPEHHLWDLKTEHRRARCPGIVDFSISTYRKDTVCEPSEEARAPTGLRRELGRLWCLYPSLRDLRRELVRQAAGLLSLDFSPTA